jgi:hypothetical protein
MRKIDKSEKLATAYLKWLQEEQEKPVSERKVYDNSNASKFRFYYDVVMNLMHCQKGLCAYTEQQLCPKEYLKKENWENGVFKKELIKPKTFNGELDHFDESLKEGNGWLWDNFFMIESDTNNRKGKKAIDNRLKPDSIDYDPFKMLDYSENTHRFVINTDKDLNEEDRKHLQNILDEVLGINFPNLVDKRRVAITRRLKMLELGIPLNLEEENEFPTAFEFAKNNLNPK